MNGKSLTSDSKCIWKINTHGLTLLPKALVYPILKHLHEGTCYERDALMDLIRPYLKGPHLQRTIQRITQPVKCVPKTILVWEMPQQKKKRKHNIKSYAHLMTGKWILHKCPKPEGISKFY